MTVDGCGNSNAGHSGGKFGAKMLTIKSSLPSRSLSLAIITVSHSSDGYDSSKVRDESSILFLRKEVKTTNE